MQFSKKNYFVILLLCCFQYGFSQSGDIRSFMFGHSLLDHRPPAIPTPSDETTVAHWMFLLAQEAGRTYAATGQYGFLPQHANLPPFAQWGYDIVPPVWDSDLEPFADADFNQILITAANFAQWQPPHFPIPGQGATTIVSATETIVDWLDQQESGIPIYIYENWPDMAGYLSNGFPPTPAEFASYNTYTLGGFHDWWLEYQDSILESRPNINVRMIPVGPILADLLTNTPLNQIPITELYEDDAPHGRATIYFLASLVTYMATCETLAPPAYDVPSIIHSIVKDNYATTIDHIWTALQNFNDDNGVSRVFLNGLSLPADLVDFNGKVLDHQVTLSWTTAAERNNEKFKIEFSLNGIDFTNIGMRRGKGTSAEANKYSFEHFSKQSGKHYYRLKQVDFDGTFSYSEIISVMISDNKTAIQFYPNPTASGIVNLVFLSQNKSDFKIRVFDVNGRLLKTEVRNVQDDLHQYPFDFTTVGKGLFFIEIEQEGEILVAKLWIDG